MEASAIVARLNTIKSYAMLSQQDQVAIDEAINYIENVEERHKISRPNPLFPSDDGYDNIYED